MQSVSHAGHQLDCSRETMAWPASITRVLQLSTVTYYLAPVPAGLFMKRSSGFGHSSALVTLDKSVPALSRFVSRNRCMYETANHDPPIGMLGHLPGGAGRLVMHSRPSKLFIFSVGRTITTI